MSVNGIGTSDIIYRWTYNNSNMQEIDGETAKSVFSKNEESLWLNQSNDTDGIQLTVNSTSTPQAKSFVNTTASTTYKGTSTDTIQVKIGTNGTITTNSSDFDSDNFNGFLEFDMVSATTQAVNPFASNTAECFNRINQETRNKFVAELTQLSNNGTGLEETLEEMTDSEVMLLNHFAGNVFQSESGKLYRQPTDEEVLSGKKNWILITDSNEILVRTEAMKRLGIIQNEDDEEEIPEENVPETEATFNVISPTVEDALEDFYETTMPLSSIIAAGEVSNKDSNELCEKLVGVNAEDFNEMEEILEDSEYVAEYYPALLQGNINTFITNVTNTLGENMTTLVESLNLSSYIGEKVAIGVTNKEVGFETQFDTTTFISGDNTYKALSLSQNDDMVAQVKFINSTDTNITAAQAAKITTSDGGAMYIIPKTNAIENMSFEEIYTYITNSVNFEETAAQKGDQLVVPYLNFSKTMVCDDGSLVVADVQQFTMQNSGAVSTSETTTGAEAVNSLNFTNSEFVVLLVGEDKNKPYYGVKISNNDKEEMFVIND